MATLRKRTISGASRELIHFYRGNFFLASLLMVHSPLPFGDSYLNVLYPFQIICLLFVVMSAPYPPTTMDGSLRDEEIIEIFEVLSNTSSDVRRDVDVVVQQNRRLIGKQNKTVVQQNTRQNRKYNRTVVKQNGRQNRKQNRTDRKDVDVVAQQNRRDVDVVEQQNTNSSIVEYHETVLKYARELVKTMTLSGSVYEQFSIEVLKELEELFTYLETHCVAM